jgi:DNA-binding beta-propeller fold protein YncE
MSGQPAIDSLSLGYVKTVGLYSLQGLGPGLTNPFSLAVSRDRRIFVLNRTNIRVVICNLDEDYLGDFATRDGFEDGDEGGGRATGLVATGASGDNQLSLPTAMAFDSRDRLHITDEDNDSIFVYDSSGEFVTKWGEHGDGDGELNRPSGIAFDSRDNAYVVDQENHRIQVFTGDGEYLLQWGSQGRDDGQLDLPWGVAVDSQDNVFVADWRNDRIQKFTSDGRFLATFCEPGTGNGQLSRPSDVAVDDEGYIYVADWGNERVQVLGPDGGFQLILRGQATVSLWARQFLDANPDEDTERVKANLIPNLPPDMIDPYYISSQTEPYFWGPMSVKLDREGRLYVVESNRHRFQVYQKT